MHANNFRSLSITSAEVSLLAVAMVVASANLARSQPETFVEEFAGPALDPAWTQSGDLNGHVGIVSGSYEITDAHGSPGARLVRSLSPGTASDFTHEIELVLNPHLLMGSGGTLTDFKWKSAGADGVLEVVINSFGNLRVNHFDFNTGNGDHIAGASPDNIDVEYTDGDALKLTTIFDQGADTVEVTYAINGGSPVSVYNGSGIDGALGDVVTNFVEVEIFKFGDAVPDQTLAAIDRWTLTADSAPAVPGDTDGDGDVDLVDLDTLGANFGAGPGAIGGATIGDFDDDGDVDLVDLDTLGANFGTGTSVAAPEPATSAFLIAVIALFSVFRHGSRVSLFEQ